MDKKNDPNKGLNSITCISLFGSMPPKNDKSPKQWEDIRMQARKEKYDN